MRIASLVPAATETLYALGVGDDVVAVTHECDHPSAVEELPRVTHARLPPGLEPAEIDRAVRDLTEQGDALYGLDDDRLRRLAPDLIVTQGLCAVCAVSLDAVKELADRMDPRPQLLSLNPTTLGEVLADVGALAEATEAQAAGQELVAGAADRIDRVREGVRGRRRVAVATLEWLDPLYTAGHWTPQLIEYAGGDPVLGLPGEPSQRSSWEEVAALSPEVVVVMPCGRDAEEALAEAEDHVEELAGLGARRVVAVDAAAYFSRPGPRLVDGLELMAHILHPERFPEAPTPISEVFL